MTNIITPGVSEILNAHVKSAINRQRRFIHMLEDERVSHAEAINEVYGGSHARPAFDWELITKAMLSLCVPGMPEPVEMFAEELTNNMIGGWAGGQSWRVDNSHTHRGLFIPLGRLEPTP